MKIEKNCKYCNEKYLTNHPNNIFCSARCRANNANRRHIEKRRLEAIGAPILEDEHWRVVTGTEYLVSSKGQVFSIPYDKIMKQQTDKDGYSVLSLKKYNGTMSAHRLVAEYFIPNPEKYLTKLFSIACRMFSLHVTHSKFSTLLFCLLPSM